MIFALWDYVNYRSRRGRYGTGVGSSALSIAYENELPSTVIDELERGDVVFTQRMNSIFSWGTMYFASSTVDHVGVYIGHGKVHHMTLVGERTHSINAVAKGARILPARLNAPLGDEHFIEGVDMGDDRYEFAGRTLDGGYVGRGQRLSHVLPPKLQLLFVALRIMTGHYIERYNWKFSVDIFIFALITDGILYSVTGWFFALPFAGGAIALTAWNVAKWRSRKKKGLGYEILSHPDIAMRSLNKYGGVIFTTLGPLSLSQMGVIPLDVFLRIQESLSMGGEGSDDSPENELQVTN